MFFNIKLRSKIKESILQNFEVIFYEKKTAKSQQKNFS